MSSIKNSLNKKVFISIFSLLMIFGIITYASIMIFMPSSYKSKLSDKFIENFDKLIVELSNVEYDNSNEIIYKFSVENQASVNIFRQDLDIGNEIHIGNLKIDDTQEIQNQQGISGEVVFKNENVVSSVMAVASMETVNETLQTLIRLIPFVLVFMIVLSLLGAYFIARYLTKPIIKISEAAMMMSQLDLSWRSQTRRTDEIGTLSESLNTLAQNLDGALNDLQNSNDALQIEIDKVKEQEQKRRVFFAAVSHELKTPITILRGELEGMLLNIGIYQDREKYLEHSISTVDDMEKMTNEILVISRLESDSFVINKEKTDISTLVEECFFSQSSLLQSKEIKISKTICPDVFADVEPSLFRRVISNVLHNAICYSPKGGLINLLLENENGRGRLIFENEGEQIEQTDLLFQPFYRIEQSRNKNTGGSGLGLYLTSKILELHHMEYSLISENGKIRFIIEFETI